MTTFLCLLTFGMDCPNDNLDFNEFQAPPPIERPVGAIPEPGAALLFAVGLGVVSRTGRKS